jgi:hypothetical protein
MIIKLIHLVKNYLTELGAPMTFLLIIIAWTFLLSLVLGMCAAARAGDVEPRAQARSPRDRGARARVWEAAEGREIYAHLNGAAERTGSLTCGSVAPRGRSRTTVSPGMLES